ncbi:Holliday junction resolvasome RuvABC endonuclease subunit [Frigoribacterium sp. PhB160]|uniref:hypothetical protein n=1 Tax=Frigoribacterium sp. PhB160 TaxID=2485192 RepID=UPI000F46E22E|nr:hypothetical protein [Frigoribacterium sp. PhB160]ROS62171.1 Holliday junction resolvasome RuvABC endonuclease subunit [Frigoribacterium sp. PhB160]
MIVVGIDPSLSCTGIVTADDWGGIVTGRAKTQTPPTQTLRARRRRTRTALARILDQLPQRVDLFVVEAPSPRSQFGSHNDRVGLYWLLVDQLLARADVAEVLPKTRAKYATGNGNADKAAVKTAMRAAFPHVPVPDDNVADALALALMGLRHLGSPLDGELTPKHLDAMDAPSWPTPEGATA